MKSMILSYVCPECISTISDTIVISSQFKKPTLMNLVPGPHQLISNQLGILLLSTLLGYLCNFYFVPDSRSFYIFLFVRFYSGACICIYQKSI
jgi:hypothetical protein